MSLLLNNKRRKTQQASSDPYWNNVVLFLKGDGTNGSTNIVDSSPNPKTITSVGNPIISAEQSKYGGNSLKFDGSSYLKTSTSTDFTFGTGDWTIELWVYGTTTNRNILGFRNNDTFVSQQFILSMFASDFSYWWQNSNVVNINNYILNQWVHIAVSRNNNVHRAFIDGILVGQPYTRTNNETATNQIWIGTNAYSSLSYFTGYLDSLRITKGVARYTSNFNPETDTYLAY